MLSVQKDLDGFSMLFLNEAMEQPRCIEAGPFCLDRGSYLHKHTYVMTITGCCQN